MTALSDDKEVTLPYILSESKLGQINSIYERSEKSSYAVNSSIAPVSKSRLKKDRLSNMLIHAGAKNGRQS